MPDSKQVTGIILAGGKSSRMRQDKGLLELSGKKLIQLAIEKLDSICDRVVISSNSEDYHSFHKEVIPDEIQEIGPMGGIYSCLARSTTEFNLVLSVDMPFVNIGLLTYLLDHCNGYYAAIPWSGDVHYEPLCASYHISILPKIKEFIEKKNYKLPDLFSQIEINQLDINDRLPFFLPGIFQNINTLDDLETARKLTNSK
jgi:molybdenum cofactor guanylyltransferase